MKESQVPVAKVIPVQREAGPERPNDDEGGNEEDDDEMLEVLMNSITEERLNRMLRSNRRLRAAQERRLRQERPIAPITPSQDPVARIVPNLPPPAPQTDSGNNQDVDEELLYLILSNSSLGEIIEMIESNPQLMAAYLRLQTKLKSGERVKDPPIPLPGYPEKKSNAMGHVARTATGTAIGAGAVALAPTVMGVTALGPVAGGAFAGLQAAGLVTAGSAAAGFQSLAMTGALAATGPIALGVGAVCGIIGLGYSLSKSRTRKNSD